LQPKPLTELDRLSYVVQQLQKISAVPKNRLKFTPTSQIQRNEAFRGLSREEAFDMKNWYFIRKPTNPDLLGKIARGETTYSSDFLDGVCDD
jgi:hypothetical protein